MRSHRFWPTLVVAFSFMIPAALTLDKGPVSTEQSQAASCANQYWNTFWQKWPTSTTAPYYTALDYVWPGGINGRDQVLQAHLNWNYTINDCGQPDVSPFASWWGGGVCCWQFGGGDIYVGDGVSYRDVGGLGYNQYSCYTYSPACTLTYANQLNPYQITQTDTRFNATWGYNWYWGSNPNGIGAGQLDLQSVGTHEAGHALGLQHVDFLPRLVMYGVDTQLGSTWLRRLGWGDYTGMQYLYP